MDSLLRTRALADRTASGHDDGTRRNHHLAVLVGTDIFPCGRIKDGSRCIDDHSCSDHGVLLHDGSFIDSAVAADEDIVLDDHREGTYRFEHAAELRGCREMDMLAHLRA